MMQASLVPTGLPVSAPGVSMYLKKNKKNGGMKILMRLTPVVQGIDILNFRYLQNGFIDSAGFILGPLVLTNWYLIRRQKDVNPSLRLISTVNVILIVWQGAIDG